MPSSPRSVYRCTECGAEHPKWVGRCEGCGATEQEKTLPVLAAAGAGAAPREGGWTAGMWAPWRAPANPPVRLGRPSPEPLPD